MLWKINWDRWNSNPWTNNLITITLLLILLISITLPAHFFVKKIPTSPKPFSFPIQQSLYSSTFLLIILTNFPLNLVSCTQQIQLTYIPTFLQSLLFYLWESPNLCCKIANLQTYFLGDIVSWWMMVRRGLHLRLGLPCSIFTWKVLFFMQFCLSILCHFINSNVVKMLWLDVDGLPDANLICWWG